MSRQIALKRRYFLYSLLIILFVIIFTNHYETITNHDVSISQIDAALYTEMEEYVFNTILHRYGSVQIVPHRLTYLTLESGTSFTHVSEAVKRLPHQHRCATVLPSSMITTDILHNCVVLNLEATYSHPNIVQMMYPAHINLKTAGDSTQYDKFHTFKFKYEIFLSANIDMSIQHNLRRNLQMHYHNNERMGIFKRQQLSEKDFQHYITHSRFCIVPYGKASSNQHLANAIAALCVPIIISDGWNTLPYSKEIPWYKFTIRWPNRVATEMDLLEQYTQITLSIDTRMHQQMLKVMLNYRDQLLYEPNAFGNLLPYLFSG